MKNMLRSCIGALLLTALPGLAHALDVGLSFAVYATPDDPYVEINLEVAAGTVNYLHVDSTRLQAGVEVMMLIKKGELVTAFQKYLLSSPVVRFPQALLDVKRFQVPPGDYTLEVQVQDLNDSLNTKTLVHPLHVAIPASIYLSDLQLLGGFKPDNSDNVFTKNGYFLEPLPFAFYDRKAIKLAFYAEVYHADQTIRDSSYLVRYFIEQERGNGIKTLISSGSQRKKPGPIDAILVQMDISRVESGNYSLTVELRNAANQLLVARTLPFQRSNPLYQIAEKDITNELVGQQFVQRLDEKTLRYALQAVGVLATGDDSQTLKNILAGEDLQQMRFYLFRHFARKDPNNPEDAYNKYMQVAVAADKKFKSGFRYGFETDRGRTYMRFGAPEDMIHVEDDPAAPPYEIWVYSSFPMTNQSNVKFLFYNPSLAGEDFILLHSNARGEINNPRWERVLYAKNAGEEYQGDNIQDATTMKSNVNRH
ncbi:MAG: GWxTD domain-containing protein, partial [Saprospiraceae bacterium]